jgi:phosphoenolpyruvate carboxylase
MMGCFVEVLEQLEHKDLAGTLPWMGKRKLRGVQIFSYRGVQAYSIAFQLLNMVEENASAQSKRLREDKLGLASDPGSWGRAFQTLRSADITDKQIAKRLARVRVEPVLTAHPTEAKRATVLEIHREIYKLLVRRENNMWTAAEQRAIRDEIKVALERLWRTGEFYQQKPDVQSELRNINYFLSKVFPDAIVSMDLRLRQAWEEAGFDVARIEHPDALPVVALGTWVGGDRDGHPLVTAEVTTRASRSSGSACRWATTSSSRPPSSSGRSRSMPPPTARPGPPRWPATTAKPGASTSTSSASACPPSKVSSPRGSMPRPRVSSPTSSSCARP